MMLLVLGPCSNVTRNDRSADFQLLILIPY
jgi:hypothetical protein